MERAATFLKKSENVALDATFQKKKYRDMMHHVAAKYHATLVRVQCVCPDMVVKKRLEDRLRKKSVSDGRWEIYLEQKTTFEPFTSEEDCRTMDTSDESYEYRMSFFRLLLSHVGEVI
jgi:predicted kinase